MLRTLNVYGWTYSTPVRTPKTNYQLRIADETVLMLALILCHYDLERKD
jgi:hypothetical protein